MINATQEYSGLSAIPRDTAKIELVLFASDACSDTVAYSLGVALKPDKPKGEKKEEKTEVKVWLVSH